MKEKIKNIIKNKKFDLHSHTTASDGELTPAQLVDLAYEKGLEVLAITDHDTLEGLVEAKERAKKYEIEIINGVELSTKYKGISVDILGYGVDKKEALELILKQAKIERENRAYRIIEKFNDIGMRITVEDVKEISGDGVYARPHIAKAIVKKGYVKTVQEVFDKYLADGKPCCIDKMVLTPKDAIELIHQSGGIASIAHPILLNDDQLLENMIQEHKFDAIEVWHSKQNKNDSKKYKNIAKKYNLIATGGSDYHNDLQTLSEFGYIRGNKND